MSKYTIMIFVTLGIAGLILLSYLSSVVFFFLSDLDPASAAPWSIWTFLPDADIPEVQSRLFVAFGLPVLGTMAAIAHFWDQDNPTKGDSRWANFSDIRKAGLFKKSGVLLGKCRGQYLINDDPTHVLCVAPTRSGKGVGLVIPNLLNWPDSLICLDVKHENYKKTAGFRKKHGQDVFMWAPQDMNSHCYNPLDALSKDPHRKIGDLEIMGWILIPAPSYGDDFWASEARSLFVGLALYVLGNDEMPSTIGAIYRLLGTEAELGDICRHIVKNHRELPLAGKETLMNFANKAAKERSGVKSSLHKALSLWKTPAIDAATSRSDFSISDLRKKKISIYVGVRPGEIENLSPLLRIFFEQVITLLSMKEPDDGEPYKVLMVMDEFHMLGKMKAMMTVFSMLGGFNCRVMAIVQGIGLLDTVYKRAERNSILSCCAHQIFFAANDLETASYISESCGERTVKSVSISQKKSFKYEPPSQNISYRSGPLISKDKARRLPKNEEIIITEASQPVKARKIVYYKDKNFKERLLLPPAVPKLEIIEPGTPEFDIAASNGPKAPEHDPNQTEMFDDNEDSGASLTGRLAEEENEKSGMNFVKAILKRLDDETD